jgi:hypothetical protein
MKKNDWVFNITSLVLIMGIIFLIAFKFFINGKNKGDFGIAEIQQLKLADLNGNNLNFFYLLSENNETYCLFFELNNCYSCIYKGIEDLKKLKVSGCQTMGIAIHDYINDVEGWSANHEYTPFFVLKKTDFYKHFSCSLLPVLVKFHKGEVNSYRFVTP